LIGIPTVYTSKKVIHLDLIPTLNVMSGTNSRPKRKIIATEKVTDPSNTTVPALASHQAAASAAAAKCLIAGKLPSAPSPESIGELAVEKASGGNALQTGDTADKTCPEKTLGRDMVKNLT
jgi:hypothetical protein